MTRWGSLDEQIISFRKITYKASFKLTLIRYDRGNNPENFIFMGLMYNDGGKARKQSLNESFMIIMN